VPYLRTLLNQALYLASLEQLRRADAVHVLSASYWSFLLGPAPALVAARALGKRSILNYHSGAGGDHLERWGARVHPFLRLASAIVVPSEYLAREFARHGYHATVIPNVVDTQRFRWRERRGGRRRLLSVRSFEPEYRVEDVLEAYRRVRLRHPGTSLLLAGAGSRERHLRRLAAGIDANGGIRFAGPVPPAAMPALYDDSDVFVSTAVVDNQPVSILEAFSAGVAVVATPAGDVPAMVRYGAAGLLVPPREPAALAAAIDSLIEHPERAAALAECARAELARYTWPRVRGEWAAVYGESAC
jgi:glycosyltransferase involved in cell wall biosynthesis